MAWWCQFASVTAPAGSAFRAGAAQGSREARMPPMSLRWIVPFAAAAGAMILSLPAAAQQPQAGTVRSTHGAWSIICDTPGGATTEQCALMQNVIAEDRP